MAFAQHHAMVFATALRILGDRSEAEDVTQAVFETLSRKLDALRDPAAVVGFLKTCAVRASRSTLSRKRWWFNGRGREYLRTLPAATDGEAVPETIGVLRLLEQLRAQERTAVVLRHVEQHSLAEVAELMGISVSSVQRALRSARSRLRRVAERGGDDGLDGSLVASLEVSPR